MQIYAAEHEFIFLNPEGISENAPKQGPFWVPLYLMLDVENAAIPYHHSLSAEYMPFLLDTSDGMFQVTVCNFVGSKAAFSFALFLRRAETGALSAAQLSEHYLQSFESLKEFCFEKMAAAGYAQRQKEISDAMQISFQKMRQETYIVGPLMSKALSILQSKTFNQAAGFPYAKISGQFSNIDKVTHNEAFRRAKKEWLEKLD